MEKQADTLKSSKNTTKKEYFYYDKKAELLRRVADLREWLVKKSKGSHSYPLVKSVSEVKASDFNRIMVGRITKKDETIIKEIENAIFTLQNETFQ